MAVAFRTDTEDRSSPRWDAHVLMDPRARQVLGRASSGIALDAARLRHHASLTGIRLRCIRPVHPGRTNEFLRQKVQIHRKFRDAWSETGWRLYSAIPLLRAFFSFGGLRYGGPEPLPDVAAPRFRLLKHASDWSNHICRIGAWQFAFVSQKRGRLMVLQPCRNLAPIAWSQHGTLTVLPTRTGFGKQGPRPEM